MAEAARARTLKYFSSDDITDELVKFYSRYVPVGPEAGDQRSEDRGQRPEVGGQRAEDRGQRAEGRGQRTEVGNREINVSSQSCPI